MTTTVTTVCNLCGLSACGMQVDVEDGHVTRVRGDAGHPESRGGLCPKGRQKGVP
jgi:anaerobic selenocysteine-containing dehydrogenase